jgi:hypothetical protein
MSGSAFINAMQWWNDELQTSHLRNIEQSLKSNLYALQLAQEQSSHGKQVQSERAEAAKNSIFSARKLLDEAEEQLDEQPNNALFLYVKVIEAMNQVSDSDFSDLSDKEYFFNVEKTYKNVGKQLKGIFGDEYIDHLRYLDDTYTLYRYLHNIALLKEYLDLSYSDQVKGFLGGVNIGKLKEGMRAIGLEKRRPSFVEKDIAQLDKLGIEKWRKNEKDVIDQLIRLCCEYDHYGLIDSESLQAIHPSNMDMFTEPLESVSQVIVEKGREYLGVEFNFIDHGLREE